MGKYGARRISACFHAAEDVDCWRALASCHMLTFLAVASKRGFQVAHYQDKAEGTLAKNADGRMAITHCLLSPKITFLNEKIPSAEELAKLHESAHRNCFIANTMNAHVEIRS